MDLFEGYIGIRVNEYQLVNDTVFAIVLTLFICFSLVFNFHIRQFTKMIKNVVQIKQRQSLFEITFGNIKGSENIFHTFMIFQALLLCSLFLFNWGVKGNLLPTYSLPLVLGSIGVIFLVVVLFYFFKQGIYALFGWTFMPQEHIRLWRSNYFASIELWGISLYLPVILAFFCDIKPIISSLLFLFLYVLCRFVIFYKFIRIFQIKRDGFLLFFLYLCGQEIMPLFIAFKGIEYLYNFIELSTLWR